MTDQSEAWTCVGCGTVVIEETAARCSECGTGVRTCEACMESGVWLTCTACFDAQLPTSG